MLYDLEFTKEKVNVTTLHLALSAAVPGFLGVSLHGQALRVHVESQKTDLELIALVKPIIEAHDAAVLTTDQQNAADRQAWIASMLLKPWGEWKNDDKDRLLQELAAWFLSSAAKRN